MIGKQGSTWDNATWASSKLKYRGSLRFLDKKCHKFSSQLRLVWMKASLVAYDFRELQNKLELKIVKYGHVRGCPK
jgi:hypothetical protein